MEPFYRNIRNDRDHFESRENPLESKLNMYERQIDQLFDFSYSDQNDIKTLFSMNDKLRNTLEAIEKKDDSPILELKKCITNYYHLELENTECYQFQLFIVQLFIIAI